MPQRIPLPREIGILALTMDGKTVDAPVWDAQGFLWLKRDGSTEEADKDFLAVKQYSALEDGIPLWLHTEVELTVSGKSREEELGTVLPEGWKLSRVESPIPVAVDDAGRMKAQVRAGKWTIHARRVPLGQPQGSRAMRRAPSRRRRSNSSPSARARISAWWKSPALPSIDVSQTPFPDKWRESAGLSLGHGQVHSGSRSACAAWACKNPRA